MFIIFIAHLPNNTWTLWIPARFGFSDATEIFVFCSGMASAIAFGKIFDDRGWWMGAARIAHRVWQVYWAHIGLFFVIAAILAAVSASGWVGADYVGQLNLWPFFENAVPNLPALLTLTYVPNYFDILPMYLVILAMLPLVMGIARLGPFYAGAFVVTLWLAAGFGYLDLPAEPWSDRTWFFNPFAWQLVFFTGFAFMIGWLPAPRVDRVLIALAIVIVIATIPFAYFRILGAYPALLEFNRSITPLIDKTHFGILRYVHFLALAYLAWIAAGEHGHRLVAGGAWGKFVAIVRKVGQQSLAVFLTSLVVAQSLAILRDELGRTPLTNALTNCIGFAILIATAYTVAWFKSQPWRRRAKPVASGVKADTQARTINRSTSPAAAE
ncbi:OpgC domain-containing protein [Breoghania sp. L-A4]|uniref:OpgC family protein n=1 Tax=Breoghania sp. L-A4 TaxID=2304600 RepID=UPI0020BFEB05|nr:OpgC domain-containing protein [Breoghania sp. L-A4]